MLKPLLDILVDPIQKTPLLLEIEQSGADGRVLQGKLRSLDGTMYAITNGIPRFVLTQDEKQEQTAGSFGYKWNQRQTYDSPGMRATAREWLVKRYGFESAQEMERYMRRQKRILDAGCGSGFSTSLWMSSSWTGTNWIGVDLSTAIDVAQDRLGARPGTHFVQADILQLPFPNDTFDIIFSEGVLHHTPSTESALKSLAQLLVPGGEIMFYVYRTKGPIREFSDDYLRTVFSSLPPDKAWEMLRPLTMLSQALAELNAEIQVPEDIPCLGIKAGRCDVQRLVYWHFAKLYWNKQFSFEENNHVNFDWYHPKYAHRQNEDQVRLWCAQAGLEIIHMDTEELSGWTVRAIRT